MFVFSLSNPMACLDGILENGTYLTIFNVFFVFPRLLSSTLVSTSCIFVVLLNFYLSQSIKYNNRWTRAGWDGKERIGIKPTRAATETRDSKGGGAGANGYVLYHFKFVLLTFLIILLLSGCLFFYRVRRQARRDGV